MDISEKASRVLDYAQGLSNTLKRLANFVANKLPQQDMLQRGLLNPPSDKNERAMQGAETLDLLAKDAKLVLEQAHNLTETLSHGARPGMSLSNSSNDDENH